MKKILCVALSLCLTGMSYAQVEEQTDDALFKNAIEFFDAGNIDQAVEIFNGLLKRNPKNPDVKYELALCYYSQGDYKKALSVLKKLKKENPNPRVYAMCGNCLDDMGKTKDAMAMYDEGMKLFPDCGQLHLEKGMIYLKAKEYDAAYSCFKRGIDADPYYPSNYFRVTQILCGSNRPTFGLMCGEVHSLLSPASERTSYVSQWLCDGYMSNMTIKGDSVSSLLCTDFIFDPDSESALSGMAQTVEEMTFDMHYADAAKRCYDVLKQNGKLSLMDVVELRKRMLMLHINGKAESHSVDVEEKDVKVTKTDAGGVAMTVDLSSYVDGFATNGQLPARTKLYSSLMKYQNKVLEAGHWEAYNMWLFKNGNVEEYKAWLEKNEDKFDAFVNWFNVAGNAFSYEEGHDN